MQTVLVTGAAGFIGFSLSKRLLLEGFFVIGYDNLNSYYDINLKKSRLDVLMKLNGQKGKFLFINNALENYEALSSVAQEYEPEIVYNLAAQAGVRYSIENPSAYIQANLVGFGNILEVSRNFKVKHLIYASSSSVYGGNTTLPFRETMGVDHPVSLYAATKKSNELMAHCYSHLYQLPTTGLRFFTVYGPWGRPDMALFLFTKSILEGNPIKIFNHGKMTRDFTYIDDIVESLYRLLDHPPVSNKSFDSSQPDPSTSWSPYSIFNIGNSTPTPLMEYVDAIESALGIKAKKEYLPMQQGDVPTTSADTSNLESWINFKPNTPITKGVKNFVDWYRSYYNV